MKKSVILVMVAAMSLSMAACGNNAATSNGKENTEQAAGSTQTETQELVEQTEINYNGVCSECLGPNVVR